MAVCRNNSVTTNDNGHYVMIDKGLECRYALLRWQTNGYFYREAPTLAGLYSTNFFPGYLFFSKYESNYWFFDPKQPIISVTTTAEREVRTPTDSKFVIYASEICCLGVFDCYPGMLHFLDDGNIKAFTNASFLLTTGIIEKDTGNNSIKKMRIEVDLQGRKIPWEIVYAYTNDSALPVGIPNFVTASTVATSEKQLQYTIRYLKLSLSEQPLSPDYFSLEKFVKNGILELEYSPKGRFSRDPRITQYGLASIWWTALG